jgi:hypothetical protein
VANPFLTFGRRFRLKRANVGPWYPNDLWCPGGELQIPPLRFASVPRRAGTGGMTKERAASVCAVGYSAFANGQPHLA